MLEYNMYTSTLIKKSSRLLIKKANELLKPYGLTDAYSYFLMELYTQDGLTQSEMHKRIGIEQPTAVRTLDRMERDGLIYRERCKEDRRAVKIWLTDKGYSLQPKVDNCAKELNAIIMQGLSVKNNKTLHNLLEMISDSLTKSIEK